jgi:hypothetical protein
MFYSIQESGLVSNPIYKKNCKSSVWFFRGFYNIAHMTNTPGSVDWALEKGANGVEIDLTFYKASGSPQVF